MLFSVYTFIAIRSKHISDNVRAVKIIHFFIPTPTMSKRNFDLNFEHVGLIFNVRC